MINGGKTLGLGAAPWRSLKERQPYMQSIPKLNLMCSKQGHCCCWKIIWEHQGGQQPVLSLYRRHGKDAGRMPGSLSLLSHGAHHIVLEIPIHKFLSKITSVESELPLPHTSGYRYNISVVGQHEILHIFQITLIIISLCELFLWCQGPCSYFRRNETIFFSVRKCIFSNGCHGLSFYIVLMRQQREEFHSGMQSGFCLCN